MIQIALALLKNPKVLIAAGLIAASSFAGYKLAENVWAKRMAELELQVAEAAKENALLLAKTKELEKKGAEITVEVVTKYVDRFTVVTEKGDEIIREVPVYVTEKADANCTITDGWVYIHNKAAAGIDQTRIPKAPINPDEASSGVTLSDTSKTIGENYKRYHQVVEQLKSLQEWIQQQEANNKK